MTDDFLGFVITTLADVRAEEAEAGSRTAWRSAELGPDTPLLGEGAVINSHSSVVFVLELEERVKEKWGLDFQFPDDVWERHRMKDVGTLAGYLEGLVNDGR